MREDVIGGGGVRGQKAHLTQEDVRIAGRPLHLRVSGLVDQFGKVSPHADADGLLHLRWQSPQLLMVLLQGLVIELPTKGAEAWLGVTGTLTFQWTPFSSSLSS